MDCLGQRNRQVRPMFLAMTTAQSCTPHRNWQSSHRSISGCRRIRPTASAEGWQVEARIRTAAQPTKPPPFSQETAAQVRSASRFRGQAEPPLSPEKSQLTNTAPTETPGKVKAPIQTPRSARPTAPALGHRSIGPWLPQKIGGPRRIRSRTFGAWPRLRLGRVPAELRLADRQHLGLAIGSFCRCPQPNPAPRPESLARPPHTSPATTSTAPVPQISVVRARPSRRPSREKFRPLGALAPCRRRFLQGPLGPADPPPQKLSRRLRLRPDQPSPGVVHSCGSCKNRLRPGPPATPSTASAMIIIGTTASGQDPPSLRGRRDPGIERNPAAWG